MLDRSLREANEKYRGSKDLLLIPAEVVLDAVIIPAERIGRIFAKLRKQVLRTGSFLPLDVDDAFLALRHQCDALTAQHAFARIASAEEVIHARILARRFFSDEGPLKYHRDRMEYFEALHRGNPNVFCLFAPFQQDGSSQPCGYTSVIPLTSSSKRAYARDGIDSQFHWRTPNIVTPSAWERALEAGDLSRYGLYIQAVGVEKDLRTAAPSASSLVAFQSLLHVSRYLDPNRIHSVENLPDVFAEATTEPGIALLTKLSSLFVPAGESADGNPIFAMAKPALLRIMGEFHELSRVLVLDSASDPSDG